MIAPGVAEDVTGPVPLANRELGPGAADAAGTLSAEAKALRALTNT